MANVQLKISPKEKGGTAEILVRFYDSNRFDQRAHSHIFVNPAMWDADAQAMKFNRRFVSPDNVKASNDQQRITEMVNGIFSEFHALAGVPPRKWLQNTIDRLQGREKHERKPIASLFDSYIEEKDLQPATIKQYRVVKRMVEQFAEEERPLFCDSLDGDDIADLEEWMRTGVRIMKDGSAKEFSRCQNTINTRLRRLRAVIRFGAEKGMCAEVHVPISEDVYGDPVFLSVEELDALYAFTGLSAALQVQRDIFVFQCHIGCRVSDLYALSPDNITADGCVEYIQRKLRKKNSNIIRVPLSPVAQEIISRYEGRDDSRLFPLISQTNYNEAIKEVFKRAGLCRLVAVQDRMTYETRFVPLWQIASSHMARRTFCGNVFKVTGSERITSSMSGHAPHSRAFLRYSRVDDEMKKDALKKLATQSLRG